jgi:hypothetical protein
VDYVAEEILNTKARRREGPRRDFLVLIFEF